ncbi:MAG: hypothetical protein UHN02_01825 [Acutalibacteraceae bacterium]|nr:hypothetical protein [Acutalibacteraceae bacterium]
MSNNTFKTDKWVPVPLVSEQLKQKGIKGFEGGQRLLDVTRDRQDGKLCFVCVETAKPYKSTDGGESWQPIGKGLHCAANVCIEIDPNNKNHLLTAGVGCQFKNGIYSSWDAGESWKMTFSAMLGNTKDYRNQIAFDASSYDEKLNASKICYWSREGYHEDAGHVNPALYKSTDGGESWKEIKDTEKFGNCDLAVNEVNGWLYIGGECGLWRSKDGGETFEQLSDKNILCLHTVYTHPENLYFTTNEALFVSTNSGDSFEKQESDTYPGGKAVFLCVNPQNTDVMLLQDAAVCDKQTQYYSHDGGKTWQESAFDTSAAVIPMLSRPHPAAWSPDGKDVITFGGDFVTKSTDSGKTFFVSNDGINAMCFGRRMSINANNENNIFLPCVNYGAFYSVDGGDTWENITVEKDGYTGETYSGYCWNENELCFGAVKDDAKVEICITRDGGKTIEFTGNIITCTIAGAEKSMSMLGDDDTLFIGEWKTSDRGHTWKQILAEDGTPVIDAVMAYDYSSQRIFARKGGGLLESYDKGETWQMVTHFVPPYEEICYDHNRDIFYVAIDTQLFFVDKDRAMWEVDSGIYPVHGVAIHPDNTDIVYVTSNGLKTVANRQIIDAGKSVVTRTTDGGKTWVTLSSLENDNGPEVTTLVNEVAIKRDTNEVYIATSSRGLLKMPVCANN